MLLAIMGSLLFQPCHADWGSAASLSARQGQGRTFWQPEEDHSPASRRFRRQRRQRLVIAMSRSGAPLDVAATAEFLALEQPEVTAMADDVLLVETKGAVRLMTLNRPAR